MADRLSPGQVKQLQSAGIAPIAIKAFQAGKAAPGVVKQIQGTLQKLNSASTGFPVNPMGGTIAPPNRTPNPSNSGTSGTSGGVVAFPPKPKPASNSPWGRDNPWAGGTQPIPNRRGTTSTPKPTSSSGKPRSTGKPGGGSTGAVFEGIEFPDYDYVPPQIQLRDFTDEANANVDKAFAPLFAAYAQQKQDINTKAGQDRQVVGGLYDQYVRSIAEGAAQTDKRYDTAGAERAQQGQALAGNVGGYYEAANQNTADLLKSIGAQQAAPELLQQGANEQAVQQAQVGQGTQAMQDYYGQQNQGAQDQAVAYQDAARNEGVRGQANVLADAASQIGGVNRQEAGSRTQQATTALDIARQLTDRDFQMQSANVGNAMSNAQFGYQGEVGNYNAQRQNILDQLELEQKQRQLDQGDEGLDIEWEKLRGSGGSGVNPTGVNAAALQWRDQIGTSAIDEISNTINQVTAGSLVRPGDPTNMGNAYIAMLSRARQIADANGVPVASVQNAMIDMWKQSFGSADTIPVPKEPGQR